MTTIRTTAAALYQKQHLASVSEIAHGITIKRIPLHMVTELMEVSQGLRNEGLVVVRIMKAALFINPWPEWLKYKRYLKQLLFTKHACPILYRLIGRNAGG